MGLCAAVGCGVTVEPGEGGGDVCGRGGFGVGRSLDHHHRQAQGSGGFELGFGGGAAGVLGDEDLDPVMAQEGQLVRKAERAAGADDGGVGRQGFGPRRIDAADGVVMPGRGLEGGEVLLADGQQDAARRGAEGLGGCCHVRHFGPAVALGGLPFRAADGEERRVRQGSGLGGVVFHAGGERVGGVDQQIDIGQCRDEAWDAAEAADAVGDGGGAGRAGGASEGEQGVESAVVRYCGGEGGGLGGAAQDQQPQL